MGNSTTLLMLLSYPSTYLYIQIYLWYDVLYNKSVYSMYVTCIRSSHSCLHLISFLQSCFILYHLIIWYTIIHIHISHWYPTPPTIRSTTVLSMIDWLSCIVSTHQGALSLGDIAVQFYSIQSEESNEHNRLFPISALTGYDG